RKAGAEVGWISIDALGRREWKFELDEPSEGAVPAFRFQVLPKDLAKLPVPNVPFGIWNDTGHATNAHVKDLVRFPTLSGLNLANSRVTDAGVADLTRLDKLVWLNLDGTTITGAATKDLARLGKLEALSLFSSKVDDASLVALARLDQLR